MVNKQDDKTLQIAAELKTNSQSMQIKCGSIYANHWINLKHSDCKSNSLTSMLQDYILQERKKIPF